MSTTALRLITGPDGFPVTLKQAKAHLRVSFGAEDSLIDRLIRAATSWAETETRRRFVNQQVELAFDRFPRRGTYYQFNWDTAYLSPYYFTVDSNDRTLAGRVRERQIFLPGGVVSAVNEIRYTDEAAVAQILTGPTSAVPGTDYQEDLTDSETAFVMPQKDSFWPNVDLGVVNNVVVDFQIGYATRDAIPDDIVSAILFRIGDLYNLRGTSDMKGSALSTVASDLLHPYRVPAY